MAARAGLAALLVAVAIGCSTAPLYPARPSFPRAETYDAVVGYLQEWGPVFLTQKHDPGLDIALADEGRVIWTKRFGCANREQRTPFTANTRSNIASVSKLFTCAAVMKPT